MITKIHDHEDKIIAYVEWWQVGRSGFHKPYGEYVWIHDFWIHPSARKNPTWKYLTKEVMAAAQGAVYCYFTREKYGGRISIYTKEQFENFLSKSKGD